MSRARIAAATGPIAIVLVVLVWLAGLVLPPYYTGLITEIGLYSLITIGLNLFMGYAGQVSLGQAAFYGIGAYTSAMLATNTRFPVSPWIGAIAAALMAALVAYLVSFVALRLRENLLALATLALGIVVSIAFANWEFVGGTSGIKNIPGFSFFGHDLDARGYAVLAWVLVAGAIWFASNLVRSTYGRTLVAISAGELGAQTLGVSSDRLKRQIFVLSAAFAGVAGALYASYVTYIDPTSFGFLLSVQLVLMSVIGGLRSLWGAVIGAAVVVALSQILQNVIPLVLPSARGDFQQFFFGAILIAMLIFVPRGIAGKPDAVRT
jgi:branched-chain amino acid transport system permease protein